MEQQMQIDFEELANELQLVHTPRLALRPLALADAWPLWEATRNPVFNSGLLWAQPAQTSEVFERVEALMQAAQQGRLAAVSAVVKETGQWVGLFRFLPHATNPLGAVEMGIWTHPAFWQGRVSLELGKACVSAAFSLSNVQLLVGAAAPSNRGACHLNRIGGLVPVRTVWRQHETLGDVELIEHEITRQQWLAQRAQDARGGRKVFEQVVLPGWNGAAPPAAAGRLATVRPLQAPLPVPPVPQPEHFREELEELCEAA
jgi:RimJ/RimL family protein N-acetyltransferase